MKRSLLPSVPSGAGKPDTAAHGRKMKRALAVVALLTLTIAAPAQAATFAFSGKLRGANEAPASASTATGSFTAIRIVLSGTLLPG